MNDMIFTGTEASLPEWMCKNKIAVLCEYKDQFIELCQMIAESGNTWTWNNPESIYEMYVDYHLSDLDGKREQWERGICVNVDINDSGMHTDKPYNIGWCYEDWYVENGITVEPFSSVFPAQFDHPGFDDLF